MTNEVLCFHSRPQHELFILLRHSGDAKGSAWAMLETGKRAASLVVDSGTQQSIIINSSDKESVFVVGDGKGDKSWSPDLIAPWL